MVEVPKRLNALLQRGRTPMRRRTVGRQPGRQSMNAGTVEHFGEHPAKVVVHVLKEQLGHSRQRRHQQGPHQSQLRVVGIPLCRVKGAQQSIQIDYLDETGSCHFRGQVRRAHLRDFQL